MKMNRNIGERIPWVKDGMGFTILFVMGSSTDTSTLNILPQ